MSKSYSTLRSLYGKSKEDDKKDRHQELVYLRKEEHEAREVHRLSTEVDDFNLPDDDDL